MKNPESIKAEDHSGEDGHLTAEGISLYCEYLHEKKTSLLPDWILNHVEDCTVCQRKIANLFEFIQSEEQPTVLKITDNDPIKKSIKHEPIFYILPLAAAVIILVSLTILLIFIVNKPGKINDKPGLVSHLPGTMQKYPGKVTPSENNGRQDKIKAESGKNKRTSNKLLAANFKALPYLENYVSVNIRSQGIEVIAPDNKAVYKGEMTFLWKSTVEKLTFSIRNNQNQTMFSQLVRGTEITFQQHLRPGLYYWILENEKEILYVGKFKVED